MASTVVPSIYTANLQISKAGFDHSRHDIVWLHHARLISEFAARMHTLPLGKTTRRELCSLLNTTAFMREVLSLSFGIWELVRTCDCWYRRSWGLLCLVYHTCGGCAEWWFLIFIVALRCSAFIFGLASAAGLAGIARGRVIKGRRQISSPTGIPKGPIPSVPYIWEHSVESFQQEK